MINDKFFAYKDRMDDAVTVEELNEIRDEVLRDVPESDEDFKGIMQQITQLRNVMLIEDGKESET